MTKIFYQKFGNTIINIGVFGMGTLHSYVLYNCVKFHDEELYIKNIHKNIGEIISEYPIDYSNSKTYDRIYIYLDDPDSRDI